MAEHSENATGEMMSNIMEAIAENLPNKKSVRFDDGEGSISDQAKKLFGAGGQRNKKSLHHVLGGGKSADVLLWRNKKISSSVLGVATLVWVFFEWLDYHFLTIVSFAVVLGMAVQFAWSMLSSNPPRVELPEEMFANASRAAGEQVIAVFFAAAIVGSFCNFLTVIYIGFVCAHTLPVLYEKYQDQVDEFFYNMLGLVQSQYKKLDKGVLSKGKFRKSD
ncbi:unnamed protein product [Urochloa humidicola]